MPGTHRNTMVVQHRRNIMRKLKARNRTEVAFLISSGPAATSEP